MNTAVGTPTEFYNSNYERNEGDRYFTERAVTTALARRMPAGIKRIWEPCAGRGDMVEVFADFGFDMIASDINLSEFDPGICEAHEINFLEVGGGDITALIGDDVDAIISNPPFGKEAEMVVRKALSIQKVRFVAMLLRTVWKSASGRTDIFQDPQYHFAYEIALTWRPRWDWWYRDKPEKSPMHNYSWFVWDREWIGPNTTYWVGRKD